MGYRDPEFEVLPDGWGSHLLADVVEIHNTKRHPLNSQERVNRSGPYPYCGANGVVDSIDEYRFDGEFVLIAEDGGYWGKHEPTSYIMRGKFWVNNHAHVVRAMEGVTTNEFFRFMVNYLNIDPFIGGDARGKLTKAVLSDLEIPLPSYAEQRRIAHVLGTVQQAIEQQERLIRSTTELKQALMQKLFTEGLRGEAQKETEIGLVPESWEVVKLGSLVNFTTGKLNSNAAVEDGKYPFFTCSQETFRINDYAFDTEAVLLAGNNAQAVYSVKHYHGKFNAYQRTYVITLKDSSRIPYSYLQHLLSMGLERLKDVSIGSSTKYLTLGILMGLPVLLPNKQEALEVGTALDTLDRKLAQSNSKLTALQDLFRTLLHELMTGKVRVGDLN